MKLLFCSSVYNMADYDHLCERSKVPLSLADHNLNQNIITGLDAVQGRPVRLINNVQIPSWPHYPRVLFSRQAWSHTAGADDVNCGFVNLPVLKHFSRARTTFSALKESLSGTGTKDTVVMTYDLHLGICWAIRRAKRAFPGLQTCLVMPDVPTAVLAASTGGKITWKARLWAKVKMRMIRRFDSYVFLTEAMNDAVNVSHKPYTVMEGIYNDRQPPLPERTTEKKVIFYGGQLNPAYGMENLLDAFLEIYASHPEYELWLCGGGGLEGRIRTLAGECPGIRYYGYVNAEAIRRCQAEASVLVNPRQNTGDLTKYSFPSKTMEYLASGRPVVGYRLDGIPAEYDEYINYVPDNSVSALRDKLVEVCERPEDERRAQGEAARRFILEKKNPEAMCGRIRDLCRGLVEIRE